MVEKRRAVRVSPWLFSLAVLALIIEYVRPQDIVPVLRFLRPGMLITVCLVLALLQSDWHVAFKDPLFRLYGALLGMMALWVPLATNNYYALLTFQCLSQWLIFGVAIVLLSSRRNALQKILLAWVLSGGMQALWVLTHNGHGLGAWFGDENDASLYLNMMLPIGLALSRDPELSTRLRYLCLAILPIMVAGVVATESRGGFVGLLAVGVCELFLSRNRIRNIALVALAAATLSLFVPQDYWAEMQTITDEEDPTRKARLRMWDIAQDVWISNPVLGVGQGNIPWVIGDYEVYDDNTQRSYAGMMVHSAYMTVLPELGILGSALYGSMVILMVSRLRNTIRRTSRKRRIRALAPYGYALGISLAAFLFCSLFISTLYYPHFYHLLAIVVLYGRVATRAAHAAGSE